MNHKDPYLDFNSEIHRNHNHLPHWQQKEVLQFVTWHLGDAISVSARKKILFERKQWLNCHPQPWDFQTEQEYFEQFDERIQNWLDQGISRCWLRDASISNIVAESLHFMDGKKYQLDTYVVMPNHVHVLFRPHLNIPMAGILKTLKGYMAFEINRKLGRKGTLWMEDYWDRMIRSRTHYLRVRRYIQENPEKAKLPEGQFALWMSEEKLRG